MNDDFDKIADFFHEISPQVLGLASTENSDIEIVVHKGEDKTNMNFATKTDLEVERVITSKIKWLFPEDKILAEEDYSEVEVNQEGRFWIIDPICGTGNLGREIRNFVTNIALLKDGELVAACAVDHSQKNYIWSVGKNEIFMNKEKITPAKKTSGISIEVDLTALISTRDQLKDKHSKFVERLIKETNYYLLSLATSLGFSYVAVGKIDAVVSPYNKLWDAAASVFLIRQAGGIVTDLEGNPWTYNSTALVGALDRELHTKLLSLLR